VRTRLVYTFVFFILVLIDQITKLLVASHYGIGESRSILGDVLRLTYVRNPGAAFSVSFGGPAVMFTITMIVIVLLIYLYVRGSVRPDTTPGKIALLMIFCGAAGNMLDRIRMGEVIDFIEMGIGHYRWPVYNLADIYITLGMILLFFSYASRKEAPEAPDPAGSR
jgi:signal peptidase II